MTRLDGPDALELGVLLHQSSVMARTVNGSLAVGPVSLSWRLIRVDDPSRRREPPVAGTCCHARAADDVRAA